nr:MAG TPA: hypothetical protein [Bacteriophage sp.]
MNFFFRGFHTFQSVTYSIKVRSNFSISRKCIIIFLFSFLQ